VLDGGQEVCVVGIWAHLGVWPSQRTIHAILPRTIECLILGREVARVVDMPSTCNVTLITHLTLLLVSWWINMIVPHFWVLTWRLISRHLLVRVVAQVYSLHVVRR
jgi:hypothetical protein